MSDSIGNFSKITMQSVVAVIMLCAVAIPIIAGMPKATGDNATIINTLVSIIPVMLAVAVIIGIVYSIMVKRSE